MSDSNKKAQKSTAKSKSAQKKKAPAKKAVAKKTPAKKVAAKKAVAKKAPAKKAAAKKSTPNGPIPNKKTPAKQSVKSSFDSVSAIDENEINKQLMASLEDEVVKIDFTNNPQEIASSWDDFSVVGEPLLSGEHEVKNRKDGFIKRFFSNLLNK